MTHAAACGGPPLERTASPHAAPELSLRYCTLIPTLLFVLGHPRRENLPPAAVHSNLHITGRITKIYNRQ